MWTRAEAPSRVSHSRLRGRFCDSRVPRIWRVPAIKPLSILVVGLYYAPETTGSAPYTTGMCRHFVEQGHDVTVVTGKPHYPQWKIAEGYTRRTVSTEWIDGVRVVRLPHYVPSRQNALTRGLYEASWLAPALPQVLRRKSDVVLAMSPPLAALPLARAAAKRSKAPWGIVLQDFMGKGAAQAGTAGGTQVAAVVDRVESNHLRAANRVAVIGPGFRDAVLAMGVDATRVDILPNWTHVEPSNLERNDARGLLGWSFDEFLVVHTGNMGNKQGLENVVDAAALADERSAPITFVVVGDGSQREALQQRARGIERIRFLPPVEARDYPAVLAAADVLLVNERPGMIEMSLPSKVTSYLSAARPIVAAVPPDGQTARMLVATGAAKIVPAAMPSALLSAATSLNDRANAVAMGAAGIEYMQANLTATSALTRYDQFLEMLLDHDSQANRNG